MLLTVEVASRRDEPGDIAVLELRDAQRRELPAFTAGAHVDVHLRDGLVRQYSLCNSPAERDRYVLGILRAPDSRGGSVAAHELLREGRQLTISEPRNHFGLVEGRRYLLFAGGIGVTPLLSMAEALAASGRPFEMHYCARSRNRAAFLARLSDAPWGAAVQLHFDDGPDAQKLDLQRAIGEVDAGTHLYVCGPTGYIEWVTGFAASHGWPPGNVHVEHFSAAAAASRTQDGEFSVRLRSSGRTVRVAAEQSILDALRDQGIEVPASCEQGVCGTCITGVAEGEPEHRDVFLTDQERARGDRIALCCSRSRTPMLVLDI